MLGIGESVPGYALNIEMTEPRLRYPREQFLFLLKFSDNNSRLADL